MRIPLREAPPRPPKNVKGTLITRAQGQDTTRKMSARCNQIGNASKYPALENIGGTNASTSAAKTTIGVYTLANFVMNDSLRDLLSSAFSTRLIILDTVLSPKHLEVLTLITPDRFTHPDRTSSPTAISLGSLSPVNATVLSDEVPSRTVPSRGIFSPGFTNMVSPTLTSSGETTEISPFRSTLATSGLMFIRCEILSRLFPSAYPSDSSPT